MKEFYKKIASNSVGFLLAAVATLIAYILVQIHITAHHKLFPHIILIPIIFILAFVQMWIQLFFFLHIAQKSSRWNLVFFIMTFAGVLTIVVASIWIMYHLNYNMTPMQINQYIQDQSGL